MIEQLPEGQSIGWMQAPPQWIFTHTVRFIGIVRVVIQDGEGFILIQKGKPLAYYFKHGRIELRGHAALDYFNSHPTIEFNLCKYSPDEFAEALRICNIDEEGTTIPPQPERPVVEPVKPAPVPVEPESPRVVPAAPPLPVTGQKTPATPPPPPAPAPAPRPPVPQPAPARQEPAPKPLVPEPAPVLQEPATEKTAPRTIPPAPPTMPPQPVFTPPKAASPPQVIPPASVVLDEEAIKIIGQIKKLNGVVAISVFNEERNIILMGDVEIEPLLRIARNMLATTRKITPHLEWGSFVHMTLQIPEGNVIVAPYEEYHLCLLTTRTINIGHIRRILRDLQITSDQD